MSSKSFVQITTDLSKGLEALRAEIPDTMKGFNGMAKEAMKAGALSALDKELIALAIGVSARCDGCVGFHVKALIRLGVTREQLMETLAVAVYMGGGPSLMYAAEAVRAYDEFIDLPMRTYSSGMYVRLGFAISTQFAPDVLLIDEVFGAGDAAFAQRALQRMMAIVEKAGIMVLASHDLALLERVCSRVLWFNKGEIVRDGPPAIVISQYRRFMAGEAGI